MNPGFHAGHLFFELVQVPVQALQLFGRRNEPAPAAAAVAAVMPHAVMAHAMVRARGAATGAHDAPAMPVPAAVAMPSAWHITHSGLPPNGLVLIFLRCLKSPTYFAKFIVYFPVILRGELERGLTIIKSIQKPIKA